MALERMTATAWAEEPDPRRLLEYAAPRICHRHLCLVQIELAERAWSVGRSDPGLAAHLAPRADGLIELVRSWCFFGVSDEVLRAATLSLAEARPSVEDGRRDQVGLLGLLAVLRAAAFAGEFELPARLEALPRGARLYAPVLAALRVLQRPGDGGKAAASLAALVRRRIPWPEGVNDEWVAAPGIVFAGEFVLRIDGLRIGDVVRREDYLALSGPRAVAFDEAQQQAAPESDAQALHRAQAAERLAARREATRREALELRETERLEAARRAEAEAAWHRVYGRSEAARLREEARLDAIARAEAQVRAESQAWSAELRARAAARQVDRWSSLSAWLESASIGEVNSALALALALSLGLAMFVGARRAAVAAPPVTATPDPVSTRARPGGPPGPPR